MGFNKKYSYKLIILTSLLLATGSFCKAQEPAKGSKIYLSPRINLGYTFKSGFNYGFDIMLGLYKVNDFDFGINFSYCMVNTNQGLHKIKGVGIIAEMDYLSVKLEAASVSRRWGLKNINRASAPGILIDVAGNIGEPNSPWVGVKSFIFDHQRWPFYDHPSYMSTYIYFKSPNIMIYEENPQTVSPQ
jgi:hypothetical protein